MRQLQFNKMKLPILFIFITAFTFNSFAQTAYEIMKKNELQLTTKTTEYENTMTLVNKRGQKRVRGVKRFEITENDNKSTLVQFIYPADVEGTSLLTLENTAKDDDRWLYLPALKQSRRIPSADISKSFMGTDFTYEDLEKEDIEDYEYKLTGKETVNGFNCFKIEATPKTETKKKETGYSKRVLYVTEKHHIVCHVKYYDKKEQLFKEFTGEEIKQIGNSGKYRMHKMTMNSLKRQSKTIIEIKNYKLNQGINKEYFTKRHIES